MDKLVKTSSGGLVCSDRVLQIREAFTVQEFVVKYNSDAMQLRFFDHTLKDAVQDSVVSLAEIRDAYGLDNVLFYIRSWLVKLNLYLNKSQGMNNDQVQETALLFMKMAPQLNLAEMTVFFNEVKCGGYGELVGYLDGVKILNYLERFMKTRNDLLHRIQADRDAAVSMCVDAKFNAIFGMLRKHLSVDSMVGKLNKTSD